VGFGTEIVFALMLGFLVLGPKRLHTMLLDAARAKAKFVEASRGFKSQLAAELDTESGAGKTDCSRESVGDGEFD
jgi:Sec-independent protein translocase protein TatA